jgi:hypothetical protein
MAAFPFADDDAMRIYNEEALRILATMIFAKQSSVAYNVRCRWLRYSPAPQYSLRQALYAIFHDILSSAIKFEIGDDFIQVFDCQFLRIPADEITTTRAYTELARGIRPAFARQTIARPSMHKHYGDYRFNAAFNSIIDRSAIVCNVAEQILAFAADEHYLQIRTELYAVTQELSYHFYTIQASGGHNQDHAMNALLALKSITSPHSPTIRHLKGSDDGRLTYSDPPISYNSEVEYDGDNNSDVQGVD